jgi:hypothetical protein
VEIFAGPLFYLRVFLLSLIFRHTEEYYKWLKKYS